jgi:hypothetical protein
MPTLSQYSPLLYYAALSLITAILISFTKKASPIRLVSFPCLALIAYQQFSTVEYFSCSFLYKSTLVKLAFLGIVHALNLLLIMGIDTEDLVFEKLLQPSTDILSSVCCSFSIVINTRGIGTHWQAKNTPAFTSFFTHRTPPSRKWFLLRQATLLTWQYLLLDIIESAAPAQSADDLRRLYGPGTEYLYLNATAEQWGARVVSTLVGWFVVNRILLDTILRPLSLLSVGIGISSPSDWPPFFGSMWDAYTLRNYWG